MMDIEPSRQADYLKTKEGENRSHQEKRKKRESFFY